MLRLLGKDPGFRYHPRCKDVKLTHLAFGDDLLLFSKGNLESVKTLMDTLETFTRRAGLIANKSKRGRYSDTVKCASENCLSSILACL